MSRTMLLMGFLLSPATAGVVQHRTTLCKSIPGDFNWPSKSDWTILNNTLDGALIENVPQAKVCHDDYNKSACMNLQKNWAFAQTFDYAPSEIMNAYFQNQSCDPFTAQSKDCEMGNYATYSISVANSEHVSAGIKFAKDKDIRLVIKNTGHDYLGKSTGKGSLSLWMHNRKKIEILESFKSAAYEGPAVRVESGTSAGELLEALSAKGYRAVGGSCASVAEAGGYTAGGGHSLLASQYGMAADNVLEWDLVTADGQHISATPDNEYSDLYWAMSGGGGGVWGVVLGMTARIYPEGHVGGALLSFNASGTSVETYWKAVEAWYAWLPDYVDQGGNTAGYEVSATAFSAISMTMPGVNSSSAVDELVAPFLATLRDLKVPYQYTSRSLDSYFDHFSADFGPLPYGPWPTNTIASSRLFPRSIVQNETANAALMTQIRDLTEYKDGFFFLGCFALSAKDQVEVGGSSSSSHSSSSRNSVLPAWRDAIAICIVHGYWNFTVPRAEMLENKEHLVSEIVPALEAATPNSGSYLNELDPLYKGDWKRELYGVNYPRLRTIKQKYDPDHLFYAHLGVSSDDWQTDDDGRLCIS